MMKTHTYSKKNTAERRDTAIASIYGMLPPPTNNNTASRLAHIDDMKYFFATAAEKWDHSKFLKRFELSGGESISCVLWDDVFFITGTDIVRSLTFRFHAFGRPVTNAKKFEEGIFSDLRNLKPGQDARLEEPKSELLDMLYKNNCIRTQKKQKVFYWYSVPHDRLFLDALERDLKREKVGLEPTTKPVAEPATSLSIDSTQELFDQLRKNMANSVINSTTQSIERNEIMSNSPIPNTTQSLNSGRQEEEDQNWTGSPSTPNPHRTSWHSSQSRLERAAAAAQAKRSRVNSVPASLGQQQQLQLLQHRHHRMSHNSYFSGTRPPSTSRPRSTTTTTTAATRPLSSSASSLLSSPVDEAFFRDDASTTTTLTDMSKSNLSSPLSVKQLDSFIDPIANGVHQLEITSSVSNTSTASSILSHAVMPSQSFDANAMKKTKAIFGNLPLFDGAPTYKQRRRRAASVSTSALLNSQHLLHATTTGAGGPERVRRHDKCHLRTMSSATNNNGIPPQTLTYPPHATAAMLNNGSSRLALAATKAGFAFPGTHAMPAPLLMPTLMTTQSHGGWPGRSQQQQDFYCPLPECGHMFKRQDHLERHIQSLHIFLCTLCGKQFHSAENLTQHHRLEHGLHQYDPAYSLSHDGDDDRDGDSSDNHKYHAYQRSSQQFLNHTTTTNAANHGGFFASPRQSFDDSRSSALSIGVAGSVSSHCSSQCSTLSPMTDLDFEMPDVQATPSSVVKQENTTTTLTPPHSTRSPSRLGQDCYYPPEPSSSSSSSSNTYFIKTEDDSIHWQKQTCQKNGFSFKDDLSSSTTSSSRSSLPYSSSESSLNPTPTYNTTPMTLLSPFKPAPQQETEHDLLQQQALMTMTDPPPLSNPNTALLYPQEPYDMSIDMADSNESYQSIYASYVNQYPPYLSSSDLSFVFNA